MWKMENAYLVLVMLMPVLEILCDWGKQNLADLQKN